MTVVLPKLIEASIINLILGQSTIQKKLVDGREYYEYSREALNLALTSKRWFEIVSSLITCVDLGKLGGDTLKVEDSNHPLLLLFKGQTKEHSIIKQLKSITVGVVHNGIFKRILTHLQEDHKNGLMQGVVSNLEHVYARTYDMYMDPELFFKMLETCGSNFPHLDALTVYRGCEMEQDIGGSSPLIMFLEGIASYRNIKYP